MTDRSFSMESMLSIKLRPTFQMNRHSVHKTLSQIRILTIWSSGVLTSCDLVSCGKLLKLLQVFTTKLISLRSINSLISLEIREFIPLSMLTKTFWPE